MKTNITKHFTNIQNIDNGFEPNYVTGLIDGEGSFSIVISQRSTGKWRVIASFQIAMDKKDAFLLSGVQKYFLGKGLQFEHSTGVIWYRITRVKDIMEVVIPHFEKYPLITKKRSDFELFKQIIKLMEKKEHLCEKGFQDILNIRAAINLGLSDKLKLAFPDTKVAVRPDFKFNGKIEPN